MLRQEDLNRCGGDQPHLRYSRPLEKHHTCQDTQSEYRRRIWRPAARKTRGDPASNIRPSRKRRQRPKSRLMRGREPLAPNHVTGTRSSNPLPSSEESANHRFPYWRCSGPVFRSILGHEDNRFARRTGLPPLRHTPTLPKAAGRPMRQCPGFDAAVKERNIPNTRPTA